MLNWKPFNRLPNAQAIVNGLKKIPSHWSLTPLQDKSPRRKGWQTEGFIPHTEIARLILNGEQKISSKGNSYTRYWSGFGLRTGEVSGGLSVIDVDGPTAQPLLNAISGGDIPSTVGWSSGKPGRYQIAFQIPDEIRPLLEDFNRKALTEWGELKTARSESGKPTELLEFRYNRCQSCLPPSRHPETGSYKWINSPLTTPVALAPQWLCELLIKFATSEKKLEQERLERAFRWAELQKRVNASTKLSVDPELRLRVKYQNGVVTDLVDFLEFEILPRLSPEQIFCWEGHNFREYGNTLKGCPPWRHSASGTSFHVWWDGTHWAWQDKATGEGGGAVQYRWKLQGGHGTPKGKDFVHIVAQLALVAGVSIPEQLHLQHTTSEAEIQAAAAREKEQQEWQENQERYLGDRRQQNKVQWLAEYPERVKWTQKGLNDFTPWVSEQRNERFLNLKVENFKPGVYLIKSGTGTGKTTLAKDIVHHFGAGNVVSYRNSLLEQFCTSILKLRFLWDIQTNDPTLNKKLLTSTAWVAACIDSLHKLPPKKVLILEEVDKLINHLLLGKTCKKNRSVKIRAFEEHYKAAEYVFCFDADLSGNAAKYLNKLAPEKQIFGIHNVHQIEPWNCYFYNGAVSKKTGNTKQNSRKDYEADLINAYLQGEKILVVSDSQRWLAGLELLFRTLDPERDGLRVDSFTKTENPQVDAFLKDPNAWIRDNAPSFLFLSPTAEASLDITIDWFDAVWGMFVGSISHWGAKQMLARLRTAVPRYIFARTHSLTDDQSSRSPLPTVIAKHILSTHTETVHEIALVEKLAQNDDFALLRTLSTMLDPKSEKWNNPHIEALCDYVARDNYSRANLRENLFNSLQESGHNLFLQPLDWEISESRVTKATDEVLMSWADAICNAPDITAAAAREILADMNATPDQRFTAQKALLKERLPELELTEQFIFERYLKDRSWIKHQETHWLLFHPEVQQEIDVQRWKNALLEDTPVWDIRTNFLAIKTMRELGLPEIITNWGEWTKDSPELIAFKQKALSIQQRVKLAFNVTVNEDSDPCYLLQRLLKKAGIPVKRREFRRGQERGRIYSIDRESLSTGDYKAVWDALTRKYTHYVGMTQTTFSEISLESQFASLNPQQTQQFMAEILKPPPGEELDLKAANVELVLEAMECPNGIEMVQVLTENWCTSFAKQVYDLLPPELKMRLPFLIKAS
jgi:hypothetical protein